MSDTCAAATDPHTQWGFCPSLPVSILFLALFALTTSIHIFQAAYHRNPYSWVIIMSGLWQTLCYVFRTLSIQNPTSSPYFAAWFVLILIAPLWTNAFVYMVVGRAVWNFKAGRKILGLKASGLGLVFVVLDVVAFVVQAYGAATATGTDTPQEVALRGLHTYMGGVGIQQLFILIFTCLTIRLHLHIRERHTGEKRARAQLLLYAIYAVLGLITLRIVFRIAEYSQGLTSTIPLHEAYQYCLDSLPMLLALIVFNAVHPGRIMPGRESDMPGLCQRRKRRQEQERLGSLEAKPTDGAWAALRV